MKCRKIEGQGWVRVDVNKEFKLLKGVDVKKFGGGGGGQGGCERRIKVIVKMQNCKKQSRGRIGGGGRMDVN